MGTKVLTVAERGKFYEEMRGTIVCIYEKTERDLVGGGAFLVVGSSQLVLTAAHVVKKHKDLYIVTFGEESLDVEVIYLDLKRDVALLAVEGQDDGFECAELCETHELTRGSEVHFIGHPGKQTFAYNVGNISCGEKTYRNFYDASEIEQYPKLRVEDIVDDFRGLDGSLKLVQVKNVHGGGRYGGTGAPFLDGDGSIVGLYSFSFQDEDNAIHVADIKASIESFILKDKGKGKGKGKGKRKKN